MPFKGIKCFNCNRYAGHIARDCPKPRRIPRHPKAKTAETGMFVGMANKIATFSPLSNETGWDMVTSCNQCQHFCGHISEIDADDKAATSKEEENENSDVKTTISVASDNGLTNRTIRSIVSQEIADFTTNYDS